MNQKIRKDKSKSKKKSISLYPLKPEEALKGILKIKKNKPKFGRWMYCKYCYKNVLPIPNYYEGIVQCSQCGAGIMRLEEETTKFIKKRRENGNKRNPN